MRKLLLPVAVAATLFFGLCFQTASERDKARHVNDRAKSTLSEG